MVVLVKDRSGSILIPKLDSSSLQRLASSNSGIYREISADDNDINDLLKITEQIFGDATREVDRSFDLWDDQGFWLIILANSSTNSKLPAKALWWW